MKRREFYQLLGLEMAVQEIERRIEAGSVFFDPYINGVLSTLGLSWWQDVLPLVNGHKSPAYMSVGDVKKFLAMVRDADQQLPSGEGSGEELADRFRKRRDELIHFLERAVKLGEPVYCDL